MLAMQMLAVGVFFARCERQFNRGIWHMHRRFRENCVFSFNHFLEFVLLDILIVHVEKMLFDFNTNLTIFLFLFHAQYNIGPRPIVLVYT